MAQIEVDEVAGLVGHVRPKVAPHDAVPGRVVLLVKLLQQTLEKTHAFLKSVSELWYDTRMQL